METLVSDLRWAVRRLRRAPGFTLGAAFMLALGIGGNTVVFTALEALLVRPLPYPNGERLVVVAEADPASGARPVAPANFLDWRERTRSFAGLAAYEQLGRTWLAPEAPVRLSAGVVSGNFLDLLGVPPAQGRSFAVSENGPREAVLSHAFWRQHLGGDPGRVGGELQLDDEVVRVIGVMPPGFDYPRGTDVWLRARQDVPEVPIAPRMDARTLRDSRYLGVIGLLRPGASVAGARAEMDRVAAALATEYPQANEGLGASVSPLFEDLRGAARPALGLLLAAAATLLLIACANVANLLLARAVARRHELSVRIALGASRARLARELLAESVVLAGLGAGAGLLLALAARPLLLALWPADLPTLEGLGLSWPVLAGSTLAALLAVTLVGVVPAREAARTDALSGLRAAARTLRSGREAHRARGVLVMAEMALAVVLVSGAALLLHSLWRLQQAPLGFQAAGAMTARLNLPRGLSSDAVALRGVVSEIEARAGGLPGVKAVGAGQALPLSGRRVSAGLRVEGRPVAPNAQLDAGWRLVTPAWFQALGVPLLRGRGFDARDGVGAPPVALVNATLARRVFGDADPIGHRVGTGLDGPEGTLVTIVGVVADTPQENVAKAVAPEMYRPLAQDCRMGPSSLSLVLRTAGDPVSLAAGLPALVAGVRGDLALSDVVPLATLARASIAAPRAASQVLALCAGLALLLAGLGVYGVVSCLVGERVPELGVRLALGARPAALVSLVLGSSLRLAGGGLVIGLLASLALSRLLGGLLYGVGARDPLTLAAVVALLLLVTVVAAWGPARRAARLDPAAVLRGE